MIIFKMEFSFTPSLGITSCMSMRMIFQFIFFFSFCFHTLSQHMSINTKIEHKLYVINQIEQRKALKSKSDSKIEKKNV